MKTVLFLRHGKSDWDSGVGSDHERTLAPRGRAAAARMGRYLARLDERPAEVLSSTAVRAADTVARAARAGEWTSPVHTMGELYGADPRDVLEIIRNRDDSISSLLLAGHEPTWSEMVGAFIGGARVRFPTAAMARIDLGVERWGDVAFGLGELVWMVTPRQLEKLEE